MPVAAIPTPVATTSTLPPAIRALFVPPPVTSSVPPATTPPARLPSSTGGLDRTCMDHGAAKGCGGGIVACIQSLNDIPGGMNSDSVNACYCNNGWAYLQCEYSSMTARCPSRTMYDDFVAHQASWIQSMCGTTLATPSTQIGTPSAPELSSTSVGSTNITSRSKTSARTDKPAHLGTGSTTATRTDKPAYWETGSMTAIITSKPTYSGTGPLLTGTCASPSYTLVNAGVTAYWAGYVGCTNDRPECCPWPAADAVYSAVYLGQGAGGIKYPWPEDGARTTLPHCPDDYYSVSGSCCPKGFSPFTSALGGQTPCWSSVGHVTSAPSQVGKIGGQPTPAAATTIWAVQYPVASKPPQPARRVLSAGSIAGIIIGILAILFCLVLVWFFVWRKRKAAFRQGLNSQYPRSEGTAMTAIIRDKNQRSNPIGSTAENSQSSLTPMGPFTAPQRQQRKQEKKKKKASRTAPPIAPFVAPLPSSHEEVMGDPYHRHLMKAAKASRSRKPFADQEEFYGLESDPAWLDGSNNDGGTSGPLASPKPPPLARPISRPAPDPEEYYNIDLVLGPIGSPTKSDHGSDKSDHGSTVGGARLPDVVSSTKGKGEGSTPNPRYVTLPPRLGPPPPRPLPPVPTPSPRPPKAQLAEAAEGSAGAAAPLVSDFCPDNGFGDEIMLFPLPPAAMRDGQQQQHQRQKSRQKDQPQFPQRPQELPLQQQHLQQQPQLQVHQPQPSQEPQELPLQQQNPQQGKPQEQNRPQQQQYEAQTQQQTPQLQEQQMQGQQQMPQLQKQQTQGQQQKPQLQKQQKPRFWRKRSPPPESSQRRSGYDPRPLRHRQLQGPMPERQGSYFDP
ncbi:hypothetical protein RB600_001653 [Gaeumannomyces tritici]